MSKRSFLSLLMLTLGLCSCNDSLLPTEEMSQNPIVREDLDGTYPYSQQCVTRGISVPDWESWKKVKLSSGTVESDSVAVPWANDDLVTTIIPTQIRKDIKKENGWMLVKYTVNGNWGKNNNYMFFYNKYTGILKVFYYLENTVASSTGIWQLKIDVPQKLLAFTGEVADPINGIHNKQELYCTNITSTGTSGFTHGWNCFQVELAYDPQFTSGTLIINPVNRTSSQITLTGSYGSSSKGTCVTTSTTSSDSGDITGLATAAGEDAYNFIMRELENNKFSVSSSKSIDNVISESISDIIRKGINQLFSSFTARYNKDKTQKYNLHFTTNGKAEIKGAITAETTGGLAPGSLNLSKASLGVSLGVWNLEKQPIIYFDTTAKLLTYGKGQFPIYHLWRMKNDTNNKISYKYDFIINPDIISNLKSYTSSIDAYTFYNNALPAEVAKYPHGSIAREGSMEVKGIISAKGQNLYEDYHKVVDFHSKFAVHFPNRNDQYTSLPRILFLPKGDIESVYTIKVGVKYNMVVKASAKLCVNNSINDTIIITKTFAPQLEWDPILYKQNQSYYEEPYTILHGHVQ